MVGLRLEHVHHKDKGKKIKLRELLLSVEDA